MRQAVQAPRQPAAPQAHTQGHPQVPQLWQGRGEHNSMRIINQSTNNLPGFLATVGHGETPEQEQVRLPGQQVQRGRRGRGQHGRDERGRPQQPQRTRDQVRGQPVWQLVADIFTTFEIFSLLTRLVVVAGRLAPCPW